MKQTFSRFLLPSLVLLSAPALMQSQDDEHAAHSKHSSDTRSLGHVSFPNSGNTAAQKPFLEGLALIHSFEYPEAVEAFHRAEKADSTFALPYWMEALSNTQLLWGIDDPASARAVLSRLGSTPSARLARARTARERAFGAAVEAFYANKSEQERVQAFADSLRHWSQRMPTDPEAHAFAALGILWQARHQEGEAAANLNLEAIKHAQYVFDRNPLHPGAAHYIIHASDAPATAQRGLRAALEYSRIAPDAEHALHMPSHIFLPLGMWNELATANERAWKASRASVARHNGQQWENDWHSLNWLQYAYLQQGRWKAARALIDTARLLTSGMSGKVKPADDPDATFALQQLAFRYGAETGDWSLVSSDSMLINPADSTISQRARGMAITSLVQKAIVAVKARHDTLTAKSVDASLAFVPPAFHALLQALIDLDSHDASVRIAALEKVRPIIRVDRYSSMLPSNVINFDEVLGAELVAAGRPNDAIKVYLEALNDRPRRAASLLGLARAQEAAGDKAGARSTLAELSKVWANADPEVRAQLH